MSSPLRCDVVDGIAEVSAEWWNALAAREGLYSSHEWLSAVEAETPGRCLYLVVRGEARLLGALPLYLMRKENNAFYAPRSHFPLLEDNGVDCVGGSRSGYRTAVLVAADLDADARAEVLRVLFDGLGRVVGEERAGPVAFLFLTGEGVDRLAGIGGFSAPVLSYAADAWLPTCGSTFGDYLAAFPRTRRKTVLKEINRFERAGLAVAVEGAEGRETLIVSLVDQLNRKYGRIIPDEQQYEMLARQFGVLGDRARLFVCRRDADVVGVTLAYEWGDALYLRLVGFDYPKLPGAYEYFNLNIYAPLRYCYENGLAGVHLGAASHHAKAVRGAEITPLLSMIFSPEGQPGPLVEPSQVNRTVAYWRQQVETLPRGADVQVWNEAITRCSA